MISLSIFYEENFLLGLKKITTAHQQWYLKNKKLNF